MGQKEKGPVKQRSVLGRWDEGWKCASMVEYMMAEAPYVLFGCVYLAGIWDKRFA